MPALVERGPLGAGPQVSHKSLGQLGRLGLQPDHETEVDQEPAIRRSQHGPSPAGQNRRGMVLDQFPQRVLFPVPEDRFSRISEDRQNRPARAGLDLKIGVHEPQVQAICQDLADSGLAGAPVTDEGQARSSRVAVSRLGVEGHSSRSGPSLRFRVSLMTSSGASSLV